MVFVSYFEESLISEKVRFRVKSVELLSNKENLISILIKDPIGRPADVFKFLDMLNSLEGGFSIALNSKEEVENLFVRQIKIELDAFNSHYHAGLNQDIELI